MPTPSLQGGLADQLAAYDGDFSAKAYLSNMPHNTPSTLVKGWTGRSSCSQMFCVDPNPTHVYLCIHYRTCQTSED